MGRTGKMPGHIKLNQEINFGTQNEERGTGNL